MPKRFDDQQTARLRNVAETLLRHKEFNLHEIRCGLPDEKPAFIASVVRQLEREGHISEAEKGIFCWNCERHDFPLDAWLKREKAGPKLTETPEADRPRERLLTHGPASLRTAELLAILIRVGRRGESALVAGEKIASHYAEQMDRLIEAGRGDLSLLSAAVGPSAYCQIMAGIELGRRIAQGQQDRQKRLQRITDSATALAYCREQFARLADDAAKEEFHIVCLDTRNQVIGTHRISVGIVDRSLVHPREVFRPAIKEAAKSIILVHNHPSGDATPSDEDFTVTSRLEEAGKTVGIQILDHIIVARNGATSIREIRGT